MICVMSSEIWEDQEKRKERGGELAEERGARLILVNTT